MRSGWARLGAARRAGTLALAALLVAATASACTAAAEQTDPAVANAGYEAGDGTYSWWAPAERSDAVDLAGTTFEEVALDLADWRGDVVVVNFWYAACPPCRAEAPDLAAISTDYAAQGVHLLGVNGTDDAATVAAFNETFGITYPSLNDADATAVAAMEGFVPLRATPSTVVLDRQGRVAAVIVGLAQGSTLRGLIDDVLAEA